jgi:cation diffusion facilitator family transporter
VSYSEDQHIKGKGEHGHTHGAIEPALLDSERGIRTVKWSLVAMFVTALLQVVVVAFTGSVALLADTIHNFGDALTAIPLWIAFALSRRPPTRRYTYGYGRAEDLAGLAIILMILISAIVAGYESIDRLLNPQEVRNLWAVALAALIGLAGNEGVAYFRIRVGRQIGSAALVADGYHAAVDGLTSLAVLIGAVGVWLGYPLADPIVGLIITVAILKILWDSAKPVFQRLLDGVDPEVLDEIDHTVTHIPEVRGINEVRVRWLGHRMHAELNIAVEPDLSVRQGHDIAINVQKELLRHLDYLSGATIHIDPLDSLGSEHH